MKNIYIKTTSLCSQCKNGVDADIIEKDNQIFMLKNCPEHGEQASIISSNAKWYYEMMEYQPVLGGSKIIKKETKIGCPYDCGFCKQHQQQVYLPVIPITSACNMNCAICYTINKNKDAYHISLEDFKALLKVIRNNDPELRIINLTGGEPSCHPQFTEILKICKNEGFERITVSTNGLLFIKDEKMLKQMAEVNTRVVLSFNSFNEKVYSKMIGDNTKAIKDQILQLLEEYNIDTTLLPVLAKGINDQELGNLVNLMLKRNSLRSLEIHSMVFTGQGGTSFDRSARITTYDILKCIEDQTNGKIKVEDFMPAPVAHPLCYLTTYLLILDDGDYVPFSQFISKQDMLKLQTGNLYIEPDVKVENILRDAISNLWSGAIKHAKSQKILTSLKQLINNMSRNGTSYSQQQQIAEKSTKAIYIHSHMDEETFDSERIKQCCVAVPELDGSNIPTCAYNILYRERDKRFSTLETFPIHKFIGGKIN